MRFRGVEGSHSVTPMQGSEAAVLHGHIDAFAPGLAVAEPFRSLRERAVAAAMKDA